MSITKQKLSLQDTVAAHGATCARAPVPCPQRCAAASVPRDELDAHLRDHCAAAGVACAFRDAGCRFKVKAQVVLIQIYSFAAILKKTNTLMTRDHTINYPSLSSSSLLLHHRVVYL